MLTNNYKKLMQLMLEVSANYRGMLAATGTDGATYYLTNSFNYPNSVVFAWTTNPANTAGIALGTGTTAVTEEDYAMESLITSGISVTVTQETDVINGVPRSAFVIAIYNTGSATVTISEVGFIQTLYCTTEQGATNRTSKRFMIDHTVLPRPISIPADKTGILRYTFKTEAA